MEADAERLDEYSDDPLERCHRRVEAADARRYDDPAAALADALAARDAAADLDRALVGDGPWLRLQALAWGVVASAYRNTSDLHRAESCLAVALAFLAELRGRREPVPDEESAALAARLALRAAYLRCDQGRFDEALELNREAVEGFRTVGDEHLVGSALLDRALVHHRAGHTERAVQILTGAVERIDRERDPRVYLAAVHNMAVYLERTAHTEVELEEALHWLRLAMAEHERQPQRMHLLKLRSLAALVSARLHRAGIDGSGAAARAENHGARAENHRARAELMAVREAYREMGATAHEAVTLLYQARLALDDGDEAALSRLAGEVFPLASGLPKDDAAREALLGFHAACRRRAVTRAVLAEAVRQVEEGRIPQRR